MKYTFLVAGLLAFITIFTSCNKDESSLGRSTLHLKLTDAPTVLDSVLIDIREVRVKHNTDTTEGGWISMNTNQGIYNLLDFQNGVDTLIAAISLPTGWVKQVRFILGDNNRVVADGVSHPLTIPSGSESGLKINVDKRLAVDLETLVIDFDAAASIRQEADSSYKLRPVLQVRP